MTGRTDRDRAMTRHADKMRKRGTPMKVLPHEFELAVERLNKARAYGMDDHMIAEQIGMDMMGVYKIRTRMYKTCRRQSFERVMQLRPQAITPTRHPRRGKVPDGAQRDPAGTQRRLMALRAAGFTCGSLGDILGVSREAISDMIRRPRSGVYSSTYYEVKALYEKLAGANPEDHGVSAQEVRKAQSWSVRKGYPPIMAWDEDTIDDPQAFPEWTGQCGTDAGYKSHYRYRIPMCDVCRKAHGIARQYPHLALLMGVTSTERGHKPRVEDR